MNEISVNNNVFESIKHINNNGCEYWYERELAEVLEYSEYGKFILL